LNYKNEVDEERQRRMALEESFKLLQVLYIISRYIFANFSKLLCKLRGKNSFVN